LTLNWEALRAEAVKEVGVTIFGGASWSEAAWAEWQKGNVSYVHQTTVSRVSRDNTEQGAHAVV
jgi:hypothetical protein